MNELSDFNNCENLLSVHLNDLGLNFDDKVKDEIIETFDI